MLKCAVYDSNYAKAQYKGMAATWLEWEIARCGGQVVSQEDADVNLITISCQQNLSDLKRVVKSIRNGKPVIAGGGGAYAPAVFDPYVNCCCVGEGRNFITTLLRDGYDAARNLPESWIPGDTRLVVPNAEFPWDVPPIRHPDGTIRLFGARGCASRCLFCQTGWEQGYNEHPCKSQLIYNAKRLSVDHKVAIVTNDGEDPDIALLGHSEFLSVKMASVERLLQMGMTRKSVKSVRLGLEGVSERLRHAVGKPLSNEYVYKTCASLCERGIGVTLFMIAGLPCETPLDWLQLRELVSMLKTIPKGCVMMRFHAFIPQPATPLGVLPLEDTYWESFEEFRRWFFHGPGFTRRVQIMAPAQYLGRMARATLSMCATERQLRDGWFETDNPNWRIKYRASKTRLRAIARSYANRLQE